MAARSLRLCCFSLGSPTWKNRSPTRYTGLFGSTLIGTSKPLTSTEQRRTLGTFVWVMSCSQCCTNRAVRGESGAIMHHLGSRCTAETPPCTGPTHHSNKSEMCLNRDVARVWGTHLKSRPSRQRAGVVSAGCCHASMRATVAPLMCPGWRSRTHVALSWLQFVFEFGVFTSGSSLNARL